MQFLSKHYKQIRSGVVPTLHKDTKTLSENGLDILQVQKKKNHAREYTSEKKVSVYFTKKENAGILSTRNSSF